MNRPRFSCCFVAAAGLLVFAARPNAAAVTPYTIVAGSEYTYKPPSEGPGIPGGMPSAYELDFGISGTFDVDVDLGAVGPAVLRLLNVDLVLTGNEAIQMNPPDFGEVTADRVAAFLEARRLHNLPVGAIVFADETYPELRVMLQSLEGGLLLFGGYDATPIDGPGILFQLGAEPVPEPHTCLAAAIGIGLVSSGLRRPGIRSTQAMP
jgi:hypothetical protein